MICMHNQVTTCELHHSFSAVSRLRISLQIVMYFLDNFLILAAISANIDTFTFNRILYRFV